MVWDAALLDWVSRGSVRLLFRTYGWNRPTLSLGRGEPYPGPWDEDALARDGIEVVRRPTGGNGVLHWEELTFAVAASIPGPWRLTPRAFADQIAEALAEALRSTRLPAFRSRLAAPRSSRPRPGDKPCFARVDAGEIQAYGFKVAGLASRFARAAALCHASVPLTKRHRDVVRYRTDAGRGVSDLVQHARSAGEILGFVPDTVALADRLANAIGRRFGTTLLERGFASLGIEEEFLLEGGGASASLQGAP